MKIYDISQEVFSCQVYPGDQAPERRVTETIAGGDICNLTALSMCAHNGTHVDAPYHFYDDGNTVDKLPLHAMVGKCYVCFARGEITAAGAEEMLRKAEGIDPEAAKRLLIGGDAFVSLGAAEVFAAHGLYLVGNESQTVGPFLAPAAVHYVLLKAQVVLLEGIRLWDVPEGVYLLSAAPLNLGGSDGAPCRAILIEQ